MKNDCNSMIIMNASVYLFKHGTLMKGQNCALRNRNVENESMQAENMGKWNCFLQRYTFISGYKDCKNL